MKHESAHKLDFACLDCIRVHLAHKEKLLKFVAKVSRTDLVHSDLDIEASVLLEEIEKDNEK